MRFRRFDLVAGIASLTAVAFAACAAPHRAPDAIDPPPGWRTMEASLVAAWIDERMPDGTHVRFRDESWAELTRALDEDPRTATVAATLIGRAADPRAVPALLERLERRVIGPLRIDDAGDCAAAMALARLALDTRALDRLASLVTDADPHPDLEVRVECALALLAHGRHDGVPFLLAVVRHATPEAAARGERITDSPTTAWPRWRAASGLERAFGLPARYESDAPPAVRGAIARDLEAAAAARLASR